MISNYVGMDVGDRGGGGGAAVNGGGGGWWKHLVFCKRRVKS